jgi:hypothetical protein
VANCIAAFNRHGVMRGQNVDIVTDNQSVCSALDEGKVHAPKCVKVTKVIFLYCASLLSSGHPVVNHLGTPWTQHPSRQPFKNGRWR